VAGPAPTTHPGKHDDAQLVALIKPCGHVLHDECLREWSQKANSCPICRQNFNLVEVLDKVGGKCLFLYANGISECRIVCGTFYLDLGCGGHSMGIYLPPARTAE
jgi:hypothetical protein